MFGEEPTQLHMLLWVCATVWRILSTHLQRHVFSVIVSLLMPLPKGL